MGSSCQGSDNTVFGGGGGGYRGVSRVFVDSSGLVRVDGDIHVGSVPSSDRIARKQYYTCTHTHGSWHGIFNMKYHADYQL